MGRPDFDESAPDGSSPVGSGAENSVDSAYFGAGDDGHTLGLLSRSDDNVSTVSGTRDGGNDGAS